MDKDLEYCETFCHVCLFPRLQDFIMNQDWNDPKSKLQQCCLTLRTMDGNEPDIPFYKVVEATGPTNTRVYKVAVYFREKRLASSTGHSIQQAEMNAAKKALENSKNLFPQLDHQKRVIANSLKRQKVKRKPRDADNLNDSGEEQPTKTSDGESRLPKQYQKRTNVISDASDISSSSLDEDSDEDSDVSIDADKPRKENSDEEVTAQQPKLPPETPREAQPDLPTGPIPVSENVEDGFSELSEGELEDFEN